MFTYLTAYIAGAVAFVLLDAIWLGLVARRFYFDRIGHLMADRPALGTASIFYLIYLAGIIVFAVVPGLAAGEVMVAAAYGAFFGFCAYATYEVTNFVTLRGWPLSVVIVDVAWGAFLTSATAAFATAAARSAMGALRSRIEKAMFSSTVMFG